MKTILFSAMLIVLLLTSCLGRKTHRSSQPNSISWDYSSKNYFPAFNSAVKIIEKNESDEKKEEALSIIEGAYSKYLEEEETTLEYLLKTQNDRDYSRLNLENNATKNIYKRSLKLKEDYDYFQRQLKNIVPLHYAGRELVFSKKNYSELIGKTRDKYSDFLFRAAKSHTDGLVNSLSYDEKNGYQEAYDIYVMIQDFDNTYKKAEVIKLKDEAYKKGQSYIAIQINTTLKEYKDIEKNILAVLGLGRWITIGKDAKGKYDVNFTIDITDVNINKGDIQRTVYDKEKEIIIQ
ncbi:hypothetical protein [Flavobacterium reichenbachii]|uniref:Lipoprotein n=1 Tax=Flavobacterium reichenbachii TaxID=362418 RepID=A0A085ZNL5_9FLAO|nr:hypothetical protein [Flavobacterium reichenbachii]KFF06029.1 hypothetical protein IW19_11065 [Flavobacterium reichenbachii]OXB14745.1 hypothetical protein B0A68_11880 [Flavobacterium reichenbachii]